MHHYFLYICLFLYLFSQLKQCFTETISYISTERAAVTYIDPSFMKDVTLISRRHDRRAYQAFDPRYYVTFAFEAVVPLDNNVKMDFYFYEFFTNRYRPSFIELHYGLCDLIDKEPLFGSELKRHVNLLNLSCPYPPRKYNCTDMAIPFVPKNFPFTRGRIYLNASMTKNGKTKSLVASGYIDMEIKQLNVNKKKH